MLYRAARPVIAGALAQHLERIKVHRHLGDGTVRQHDPAVAGARLHADLAQAGQIAAHRRQRLLVAADIGVQLFGRGVLLAHLADLAAQANGHARGFQVAHELGQFRRAQIVVLLLLVQRRRLQRNQRARVNVDVPETGGHGLGDQVLDFLDRAVRVLLIRGRLHLEVVALDKDRPAEAFLDGGGDQTGRKLNRLLIGVAHFAARDLKDDRARVGLHRRTQGRAARVVGGEADIHGGDGAVFPLPGPAGDVEVVNAARPRAHRLARFPDQPAGERLDRLRAKDRIAHQGVDVLTAQLLGVQDLNLTVGDAQATHQRLTQFIYRFVNHR